MQEQTTIAGDLIDPPIVETDYGIPQATQAVWRCANRYGWADITIKVGRRVKYQRTDVEAWLSSRKGSA